MAKLYNHGRTPLAEFCNGTLRVMPDGVVLVKRARGWKIWAAVPVRYREFAENVRDEIQRRMPA